MKTDRVSFQGNIFYIACPPGTMSEARDFAKIPVKVSEELKDFVTNSKFLNRLKEDKDVYVSHMEAENIDVLSLFFEHEKGTLTKDSELCNLSVTLPKSEKSAENFKKFENILENNSNIKALKKVADILFPKSKHKLVKLRNNNPLESGYCEFWFGKRTADDTLGKLFVTSVAEIENTYNQINGNILNKLF